MLRALRDEAAVIDRRIAIHGLGYVGLTAAVHWARAGWTVIGYDPDENTIQRLRDGTPRAGEFLEYLDADVKKLVRRSMRMPDGEFVVMGNDPSFAAGVPIWKGCIVPTSDFADALLCPVQSIAVPTERDGEPYSEIALKLVENLLCRLLAHDAPLDILVESTMTVGTIDAVLATCGMQDGNLGPKTLAVCPRRDWFAGVDSNLAVMKRVVGGVNEASTRRAVELLSNVSSDIEPTDYRTAEITKALENALLHAAVMLPTELAMNMRDRNVAEALRLASTHPRLMPLYMGGGSGGRCIPLGPKYLSAHRGPHELLNTALTIDRHIRMACADAVAQRGCKTALVLGIAYRPDFRDAGNSPGLAIAQHLRRTHGIEVAVADPMWTVEELENLTGFRAVENVLAGGFDAIVLVTPHSVWKKPDARMMFGRFVLDCQGTWRGFAGQLERGGVEYKQLGEAGWLK
jgi:nucleotide sugar dehydrogenase